MRVAREIVVVYRLVKWLFPKTYRQIKDEVTQFYEDLGVRLRFVEYKMAVTPLQEGCMPEPDRLEVEAFIDKGRNNE